MSKEQPRQYPDPEAIRQKRIAELEREFNGLPHSATARAKEIRAELSRLRNEQPPTASNEQPKCRICGAMCAADCLGDSQEPSRCQYPSPSQKVLTEGERYELAVCRDILSEVVIPDTPSPLPGPQDVREALKTAIDFIADEYRDPTLEPQGEWLPPKARQVHAQLVAALTQSDAQPVGWQSRLKVNEGQVPNAWVNCTKAEHDALIGHPSAEVRPLYTAPPRPDASGLIEAAEVLRIVDESLVEAKEIATRDPEAGTVARWLEGVRKHIDQLRSRAADRSAPRSDKGGA